MSITKYKTVCRTCQSEQVLRDAWVEWDQDTQKWELHSIFDESYCMNCEGEATLEMVPLTQTQPTN